MYSVAQSAMCKDCVATAMASLRYQPLPSPRITRIGYLSRDNPKDLEDAVNKLLEKFPRCQPLGPVAVVYWEGEERHWEYTQTLAYYGKAAS